ncbi:MAG: YceI family protein [Anaerolineae bacterium]|nr:YceI family protein [Anaerolineae bacterium]
MIKRVSFVILLLLIAVLAFSACGVLSEPEAPSAPIEAVPLAEPTAEEAVAEPTAEEGVVEPTAEESVAEPAAAVSGGVTVYTISPEGSLVRFELDEDLRGERVTVVGETDQVAGELAIDLNNLADTQVGVMQINARGLATDNNFRNRAIQNEILNTGNFEFITFEPTAVTNLPESAAVGDTVEFTIEGNLTITDKTQPVSFAVTATMVSEDQITGTATAVVNRTDFGLNIPSVPNVANVEEEVELTINFTANAS